MPILNMNWTGKQSKEVKQDFFDFCANTINEYTGTKKELVYVFLNEWDKENARKTGPVLIIDWTENKESRTPEAKKNIAVAFTEKLCAITGEDKSQVVVLFNDYPLTDAAVGGLTRAENRG